jgi:hypothetical protein
VQRTRTLIAALAACGALIGGTVAHAATDSTSPSGSSEPAATIIVHGVEAPAVDAPEVDGAADDAPTGSADGRDCPEDGGSQQAPSDSGTPAQPTPSDPGTTTTPGV